MANDGAEKPTSGGVVTPPGNRNSNNNGDRQDRSDRGRGRHNNRRGNNRNTHNNANRRFQQRFEGREPSLRGFIYDSTGERNPDQYIKTTKEIINYVGRTYTKFTGEFTQAVRDLELEDPQDPADPDTTDLVAFEKWKLAIKEHRVKVQEYANFRAGLYNVVLGQCTEALQDRLRSHIDFPDTYQDGIGLLAIIKTLTYAFEERRKLADALCDIKEMFYSLQQGRHMTLTRYHELFLGQVEVLDEVGVAIADTSLIDAIASSNGRDEANDADRAAAREQALAMRFIRGTNANYAGYLTHLRNSFLEGNDNYPTTLHEAYNILQRREMDRPSVPLDNDGVAFTTDGTTNSNTNNNAPSNNRENVTCFHCQEEGHYANQCPNREQQGTNLCTTGVETSDDLGFSFSQSNTTHIPKTWILLDNQSTIDLFCNANLLRNIRKSNTVMHIKCNAGTRTTELIGELPGYGTVWFYQQGIANILSLKHVRSKYHVAYETDVNGNNVGVFIVTKPDGTTFEFKESNDGLYYLDTSAASGTVMVNTVRDNKSNYTNSDYLRAVRARELQIKIGRPSLKDFIHIVTTNQLPNCPVTRDDILAAEHIFGPDIGCLKGKTTRHRPHLVKQVIEPLPPTIMNRYRNVTLCADIMFVNSIPMFVSISRNIRFATVEAIPNKSNATIIKSIKAIAALYHRAGFRLTTALMDGEFESLHGELANLGIVLNETARDEHVGDIERFIRTVKERMRATYNTLPFQHVPGRLVIEMAKSAVYWLNAFPTQNGISTTISPRTLITGQSVDYNRHCKFQFGQYVQTHEPHNNTMIPRTIGALALRPTGNQQGNFFFFSLSTGRVLNRNHATPLPMPDDVINCVHNWARQQKANPGLLFEDRNNILLEDYDDRSNDDESYTPSEDGSYDDINDIDDYDDEASYNVGPNDEDNDNDEAANHNMDNLGNAGVDYPEHPGVDVNMDEDDGEHVVVAERNVNHVEDAENAELPAALDQDDEQAEQAPLNPEDQAAGQAAVDQHMDNTYGARSGRYNLRRRKQRDYSHLFTQPAQVERNSNDDILSTPQMTLQKGLKLFGDSGVKAVRKEMQQLHDQKVMQACNIKELTNEQRKEALAYLMFLKRKRSGQVKGRGCADGRKQRAYITKEDAASPTVATEAVFLTAVVDAYEDRDVGIMDLPGAFMQADMDELVHVRFTGTMLSLLLEIDPEMYGPYVTLENGRKVLYVELLKALYGTIRAARLFWEKLSAKLQEWGFVLNPYDSCVANKMMNDKQLTVVWHVDDLKVSHVDPTVVDDFINQMEIEFGKEAPLNVSRGKIHDYLGMTLDFSKPGELTVIMTNYIKTILHDLPKEMQGKATSPAANHLFQINSNNPVHLNTEKSKLYVHLVMQLLYLSQRGRPDLRTAVSFLCGRLKQPDEDDYKKLCRVVKYLQATLDLPLVLAADGTGCVQWWVDASFAVHPNMRSHTGGTMSLGKGCIYSTSTKQKLVTRSSTESEVVAVHDVLPQMLWTSYFLKAQGIHIDDTVLYQDNQSSILLEKNGKSSSSKRTRHMQIRYFFIKDHVMSKDIRIQYCPTGNMLADFFTKPLQGQLFLRLRDQIMHIDPRSNYHSGHRSVLRNPTNISTHESGNTHESTDVHRTDGPLAEAISDSPLF